MRQKKSNLLYYIIVAIVIGFACFVSFTEIPAEVEHVEQNVK